MNHLASLAQAGLAASGRLMIPVDLANGCLRSVVFGARSANLASLALSGHCREGCDKLQRVAAGWAKRPFTIHHSPFTIHHLLWQASHKNPVNPSLFLSSGPLGGLSAGSLRPGASFLTMAGSFSLRWQRLC